MKPNTLSGITIILLGLSMILSNIVIYRLIYRVTALEQSVQRLEGRTP